MKKTFRKAQYIYIVQKMSSNSAKENTLNADAIVDNADPDFSNATKRQKIEQNPERENNNFPRSYVTWNCNGFSSRAKKNQTELQKLLDDTNYPDVICIQEARLKASGPDQLRGQPLKDNEYRNSIQPVIDNIFIDYRPFWSLADKKYAGTLTLIHNRCYNDHNNKCDNDDFVAFTPQSAIDLMLRRFNKTRSECGLEVSSSSLDDYATAASNAAAASSKPKKQQASLKSFFAPKKDKVNNSSSSSSATKRNKNRHRHRHNIEGRFQYFFFQDMDVVQTYVPNNGSKEESFQRRRDWDRNMLRFMMDRKKLLQQNDNKMMDDDRKLLWIGDMNVANEYKDGTHWEHKPQTGSNNNKGDDNDSKSSTTIYEWWTDEKKCLGKPSTVKKDIQDVGMPGFTQGERDRFHEFLKQGDFCDIWKELHPMGIAAAADSSSSSNANENDGDGDGDGDQQQKKWELANYTWRGQQSKNPGGYAKYQGRGQRIDYFLLSPASKLLCCNTKKQTSTTGTETTKISDDESNNNLVVDSCDILGYGTRMEGLFCGSDHCAVKLTLS
jgi:exonuclease III